MYLFNYKTYFFGLLCILLITHLLPIANSTLTLKAISGEELVAYWKFDEGSGTLAYDLSGKNDATIYGAAYVTDKPGKIGYALEFNRPKQTYIETTLIQMPVQTISLWFKMHPNQLGGPIASSHIRNDDQGNFVINAKYADECGMIVRGIDGWDPPNLCAGSGPNEYADDIWHHLAFASNNGEHKLYIDGDLKDTYMGSALTDLGNIYFSLNAPDQIGSDYWYDGLLDEVRIYSRALNDEEIQDLSRNPDGMEPMLLKGTISNLDSTAGSLISFTAEKLRITTFLPFETRCVTSGETIIVTNQYFGIFNPHFIVGIFKGEI